MLQEVLYDVMGIQWNYSMPRQARLDIPGALHHIICRGILSGLGSIFIYHLISSPLRFVPSRPCTPPWMTGDPSFQVLEAKGTTEHSLLHQSAFEG